MKEHEPALAEMDDDGAGAPPWRKRREAMIERLYRALDGKMREIEARISRSQGGADDMSPADAERDARTLNTLTRLFEKLNELDGAKQMEGAKEEGADPAAEEIDAERFRRDIAERIAFAPITFSARADTAQTIRQIRGHNAAWDAVCARTP